MAQMEAGKGNPHVYKFLPEPKDDPLTEDKHYIRVDVVSWFVNEQSNWRNKFSASADLRIGMLEGRLEYLVGLGVFNLSGGTRFAPGFDQAVLPWRSYPGGDIKITARLNVTEKNTTVTTLLQNSMNVSLGLVAGMVQTATQVGSDILMKTGGELIKGVREVLMQQKGLNNIFQENGIQAAIDKAEFTGDYMYILLHRGSDLDKSQIEIKTEHNGFEAVPVMKSTEGVPTEILIDGAWILLSLRKSDTYQSVRDWKERKRSFFAKIKEVVNDVEVNRIAKDEGLKKLEPNDDESSIMGEYFLLRAIILTDGVINQNQADNEVRELRKYIQDAKNAITGHETAQFQVAIRRVEQESPPNITDQEVSLKNSV